jgi:CRISPR/Cas system-associated protein Csm6
MMTDLSSLLARARKLSNAPAPKVVVLQRNTFDALLAVAEAAASTPDRDWNGYRLLPSNLNALTDAYAALTAALTAALGENE